MALSSNFLLRFCCFAWLSSVKLGCPASREEAQISVLSGSRSGPPRLQPDARALHYMKKLYKTYATKEGIPKSTRSHLYNTVRLFTPHPPQKFASGDRGTGIFPSADLLFNLDRVAAVEHLLRSVLLYTLNSSVSLSSAGKCVCSLVMAEPRASGKALPGAPSSFPFSSQLELRKNFRWIEIDVTSLLQPLVASNERSVHMFVNFTCPKAGPGRLSSALLSEPPSLILYLNDTSAQAHHRWYSLRYGKRSLRDPGQRRGVAACPAGEGPAEGGRSPRPRPRRGRETLSPGPLESLLPASFTPSQHFKRFLFPHDECELLDFRLSFRQLRWDHWIVAPQRYNPRFCKGGCPRAVRHRYGSPLHTVVQNIIYEKLDASVPRPSCVPAAYNPLSVLTIEPDASIAYKEYENMIATRCTCR
ncbi:growth/differentiation factor 9 isoform X2 [Heterocephalus glaber]|uniref:Growth/differentiation factor 9 isoform X2 n=1 Tax=Heterocephalus glaber TaxID=10181 RepID=A0AAX6RK42_HETGA|nr:growth/differentiation factor 9 isoform X2 [Heterocephalus glaber]